MSETNNFITNNFIEIKPSLSNIWMYQVRKNVLSAFKTNSKFFKGDLVDLGCGLMPYKKLICENKKMTKYLGIDLEKPTYYGDVKPDLTWDGSTIPLPDNSVDTVIATEVLEHCYEPEKLLKEVFRVLKKGGVFFCTVPFIWHLHETPYDEYRYTPFSLNKKITESGFIDVKIEALGGWDSALSQLLGLYVTFRPMKRLKRSILLRVAYFIIKRLEKSDKKPTTFDNGANSMISGLSAICFK